MGIENLDQNNFKLTDDIVFSLQGWVHKHALKYYLDDGSVSFSDLVQEGLLGLVEAAQNYDPTKSQFITHSTYKLRQRIQDVYPTIGIPFKIPSDTWINRGRVLEIIADLQNDGDEPSNDTVVTIFKEKYPDIFIDRDKVDFLLNIPLQINSLDAPHPDTQYNYYDSISSDTDNPAVIGDMELLSELIRESIVKHNFSPKIQKMIVNFALDFKNHESGDEFGITKERVRQLLNKAFDKLRNDPKLKQAFEDYFSNQ